jgi:hypothetical protein
VHIVPAGDTSPGATQDVDSKFLPFMVQHGIQTMLVRPDFYLYGAETTQARATALLEDWLSDLTAHGVHIEVLESSGN